MTTCKHPYRVFISYSHEDARLATRLAEHFEVMGVLPVLDHALQPGASFTNEIKHRIADSHVFVSILTQNSQKSPWVHQEIGFALGLGLPVMTLALDELPKGMVQELQALKLAPDLGDLAKRLTARGLDDLVASCQRQRKAMFECADRLHDRTRVLVDAAQFLLDRTGCCRVRQRSAFSSFSIPDRPSYHADWDASEGDRPRDPAVRELLRQERRILERHAREAGCDLLVDPYVRVSASDARSGELRLKHDFGATLRRLELLLQFLDSMPDDKVRLVIQRGQIEGNITSVGDWIVADAVVPYYGGGYKQTIFTRHAPTVLSKIHEFDRDFEQLLNDTGQVGHRSRRAGMQTIHEIMTSLKPS